MLNVKVITVERLSKHGLFGRIRKELTVHRLQNFLYYYLFISALFIYFFYLGSVARRKSLLSKRSTAVGCRFAK